MGGQHTCVCQQLGQRSSGLGNTKGLNTTMRHEDHVGSVVKAPVSENELASDISTGFSESSSEPTHEYTSSHYGGDYDSDSDSSFIFVTGYSRSDYGTD